MYDLCIVGGGAAGMSCAIAAAEKGLKVIVCDRNNKIGKKLYATGNGKCNITNHDMNLQGKYNSSNDGYADFLDCCLEGQPGEQIIEFCNSLGVLTYSAGGYVYPLSSQASTVVWAMLDRMKEYGVQIDSKREITDIDKIDNHFVVKCENGQITASQVVLACGGRSYPALGGTVSGYNLAKSFGHRIIPVRPSLCGLETEDDFTGISGVRTQAKAYLLSEDKRVSQVESGELQIASYGVSGIMIFNLSSQAGRLLREGKSVSISLNLLPELDMEEIRSMYELSQSRTVIGFLNGFINDKLAQYFAGRHGIDGKQKLSSVKRDKIYNLIDELYDFRININGLKDYDSAQVCAGGVDISDVDPHTMMSKITPGLYITGELLDIDGVCGGYNLTFAMLTGLRAGRAAAEKINMIGRENA